MRRILQWFSVQKLLLFVILGVVAYQSRLTGSQWLLGWDSVAPELDWKLNFTRVLAGAWQEYQGVGLTGGMAHLADLPRMVILWLLHFAVATQYLRWMWHMGMLALGTIGVWYLGKRLWKWGESSCLAASVFYLLNLATVQYFFVPYEAFSSFYGFLPWLVVVFLSYLENGVRNDLKKVAWMGLLATSAFYVQTLFVVYVMIIGLLALGYLRNWKRIATGFLTVLAINAFWLLPIIYGVINGGGQVGLAKINSIGSPETALMNSAFGSWQNVTTLKGYWLEYIEWVGGSEWGRLIQSWWMWSGQSWVEWAGWGMFGASILGICWSCLKRKMNVVWVGGLLLAYAMLASFNPPFGFVYQLLVDKIPLFGEMFRSVFTKWSIVMALFVSVGLGNLVVIFKNKGLGGMVAFLIVMGCGGVVWLIFGNGIIFEKMKVELPQEYTRLFEFMRREGGDRRVAYLPTQSMWSWKYTDWGYRGSGFLWYGIEQPILDRAFDVWSPYNEGFYNEFSTALYGGKREEVERVLAKYDVRYVLLDESVIAPGQDKAILRIEETKEMAGELGWETRFHEGFLTVWDTGHGRTGYVSAPGTYTLAEGDTLKTRRDVIYQDLGEYVSQAGGVSYPLANLLREEIENVEFGDNSVKLVAQLESDGGSRLTVPGWTRGEEVEVQYRVKLENGNLRIEWEPAYLVNGMPGPRLADLEMPTKLNYAWVKVGEGSATFVEQGKEVRGRARLVVGEAFTTWVYDGVVVRQESPEGWQARERQICGEHKELECYAMRLPAPGTDSLLQTVSPYEGEGLEVCLDLEGEPYKCENLVKRGVSPVVNTLAVHKGERYWLDYVVEKGGAIPRSASVRWYTLIGQWTMDDDKWEAYQKPERFELQDKKIQVTVPGTPRIYDMSVLGSANITNCDVLKRGSADKKGSTYTADERGAVCDYVELAGVSTNLPYLLRISGEATQGRPPKIFLYNQGSRRNDLEYLLGKGRFDQAFSLLPWAWQDSYTLNTETRSFGEPTANKLDLIEARYLPLEQLAGARVGETARVENKLQVKGVQKTGTWLYRVQVEGSGLLKLSQGYDEGWVGVRWPMANDRLAMEHVKVDGWANGWMVEEGGSVTVLYWPQLLEYLGFILLGWTIFAVMRSRGE